MWLLLLLLLLVLSFRLEYLIINATGSGNNERYRCLIVQGVGVPGSEKMSRAQYSDRNDVRDDGRRLATGLKNARARTEGRNRTENDRGSAGTETVR